VKTRRRPSTPGPAGRAAAQRFSLLADLVPTAEAPKVTVACGSGLGLRRSWTVAEPPGGLPRSTAALRAAMAAGRRVLLFTDRRVTTMRCVRCRTIRRCGDCGAAPGGGAECRRCGAPTGSCAECGGRRYEALGAGLGRVMSEAGRIVGAANVGEVRRASRWWPTERDLRPVRISPSSSMPTVRSAPTYRAAEDGLRLIARAAAGTGRTSGVDPTSERGIPPRCAAAIRSVRPGGCGAMGGVGVPPGGDPGGGGGGSRRISGSAADEIGDRATVLGLADGRRPLAGAGRT
jgi:hypothetical protein